MNLVTESQAKIFHAKIELNTNTFFKFVVYITDCNYAKNCNF